MTCQASRCTWGARPSNLRRGDSGTGQYGDGDWAATGTRERGSIVVSADSGAACDGPGAGVGAWMTMPQWPQKRACGGLS